jgi:hypothetical protein
MERERGLQLNIPGEQSRSGEGSVTSARSPDGAKRNPGLFDTARTVPDYATLHPGYESDDN